MILSEMESDERKGKDPEVGWQAANRLMSLHGKPSGPRTSESQIGEHLLSNSATQGQIGRRRWASCSFNR